MSSDQAPPAPVKRPLGWWTIAGETLLAALREAHNGADPDLVYVELYSNSTVERPGQE